MFLFSTKPWSESLTAGLIAAALYSVVASPHSSESSSAVAEPSGRHYFADNGGKCQLSLGHTLGKVENVELVVDTIKNEDGIGSGSDSYTQYNGDGTYKDGWPSRGVWVSFVDM